MSELDFTAHQTRTRRARGDIGGSGSAGVALVAVLWIVASLSLLAMSLVSSSRGEVRTVQMARAFAEAAANGDAVIEIAAREIYASSEPVVRFTLARYLFEGREFIVRVTPATGFIDLNAASEALLRDLFVFGAGLDEERAEILVQRIIDWRDPDDAALPLGAEDEAYVAAGVSFRTRGGPFEGPEDLLQVLGINYEVYDKIHLLVTTSSGAAGVDPLAASPAVLRVLAGGNDANVDAFIAARDAGEPLLDMTGFTQEHLVSASGAIFHLEALYPLDAGARLARARWVDLSLPGALGLPWRTLRIEPVRSELIGGLRGS